MLEVCTKLGIFWGWEPVRGRWGDWGTRVRGDVIELQGGHLLRLGVLGHLWLEGLDFDVKVGYRGGKQSDR